MKLWKNSLISALAFFGICIIIVYTSCDRDSCLTLKCKNQAPCVNGYCQCPTGYEGAECRSVATDRFVGTYPGNTTCTNTMLPAMDTIRVDVQSNPNIIAVYIKSRPDRKYIGTIEANTVQLKDTADLSTGHLVLDNKKITIQLSETVSGENRECTFVGNRP
jgi:hypothetical protein